MANDIIRIDDLPDTISIDSPPAAPAAKKELPDVINIDDAPDVIDLGSLPDDPTMSKEDSGMLAGAGSAIVRGYQDTQAQAGIAEKFRLRGYKTALENGGDFETDVADLFLSNKATPAQVDLLRRGVPKTDPIWRQAEIARVTNEMAKLDQSIKDADATIGNYQEKSLPYQQIQTDVEQAKRDGRPFMGTVEALWNNPAGLPEFAAESLYGTAKPIAGAIGTALALRRGNAAPLAQTLGPIAVSMGITGLDSYKGQVAEMIEKKAQEGGINLRKNPEMMDSLLTDANFIEAVKTDALKAGLNDAAWAGISTWLGMTPKIKGIWQPLVQAAAEGGTDLSRQLVIEGKVVDPSAIVMSTAVGGLVEGPGYAMGRLSGAFGKPAAPAAGAQTQPQAQPQTTAPTTPDVINVDDLPDAPRSVAGETGATPPAEAPVKPTPAGQTPEWLKPAEPAAEPVAQPAPVVEPVADQPAPAPERIVPTGNEKLPRDLAGARPRFGYGDKNVELTFESDLDKAAYVTSQQNKNKRHDDYVAWVKNTFGIGEAELMAHGKDVRAAAKEAARTSTGDKATVANVIEMPSPKPAAKPARSKPAPSQQTPAQPAVPAAAVEQATPAPAAPIEQKRKLFRGFGRDDKGAVYTQGTAAPVLGGGKYYAFSEAEAKQYGPKIETRNLDAKNPLVIRNDSEWRALTKEAGWKYPNPFGRSPDLAAAEAKALNDLLRSKGHDAIVIEGINKSDSDETKTLSQVFGSDQVYFPETSQPVATAQPEPAAPVAEAPAPVEQTVQPAAPAPVAAEPKATPAPAPEPVATAQPEAKPAVAESKTATDARSRLAKLEAAGKGDSEQAKALRRTIERETAQAAPDAQAEPETSAEPAAIPSTPEREAKIKTILDASEATDVSNTYTIREVIEQKGSDGKWYTGVGGTPAGVKLTGEKRSGGYGLSDRDGRGIGRRFATEAEAKEYLEAGRKAKREEFRKSLEGSDDARIDDQVKFWEGEKARFERLNPKPAEPTPAAKPVDTTAEKPNFREKKASGEDPQAEGSKRLAMVEGEGVLRLTAEGDVEIVTPEWRVTHDPDTGTWKSKSISRNEFDIISKKGVIERNKAVQDDIVQRERDAESAREEQQARLRQEQESRNENQKWRSEVNANAPKGKKGTFKAQVQRDGEWVREDRPATIYGDWAVSGSGNNYDVHHVGTGLRIRGNLNREQANTLARGLIHGEVNGKFTEPDAGGADNKAKIKDILLATVNGNKAPEYWSNKNAEQPKASEAPAAEAPKAEAKPAEEAKAAEPSAETTPTQADLDGINDQLAEMERNKQGDSPEAEALRAKRDEVSSKLDEAVAQAAEKGNVTEQSILEALDKAAKESLSPKNFNEGLSSTPRFAAALTWATAREIQRGLTNFAKWAAEKAKQFPSLKGSLQAIWNKAQQIAKNPIDYLTFRALDNVASKAWQNVARNKQSKTLRDLANLVFAKGGPDADAVENDIPDRIDLARKQFQNTYANIMDRFAPDFAGMSKEQRQQWDVDFRDFVLGRRKPTDMKMAQAVKDYRNLMRDLLAYQREAGITMGDVGEKYFPRHYDLDAVEADRDGFVKVAQEMYRRRDARLLDKAIADVRKQQEARPDERRAADKKFGRKEKATHEYKAEAAEWADEKIAALEAEHAAKDDAHYQGLAEDWATAITHGDVLGLTLFKNTDGKVKSDATDARTFNDAEADLADKYLKKNIDEITAGYVDGAVRGAELARVFGEDGKKFEQMMNRLSAEGVDKDTVLETRDLVAQALGVGRNQLSQSESVFFDWVNVVLAAAYLGKTFIYNMTIEPASFGIRTGNAYLALKGVAETWKNTIAEIGSPSAEMKQRIKEQFGDKYTFEESVNAAVSEQLGLVQKEIERAYLNTHWDYSSGQKGSKMAKWISQRIYRANLLAATEKAKVQASVAISRLALRDNARFLRNEAPLQKLFEKLGMDTRADKSVATIFNENGIPEADHKAFADWVVSLEGKTDAEWQKAAMGSDPMAKHYRRALQRMSRGMSIRTNNSLKLANSDTTFGRLLMQLMNYSYAYGSLVKDRMYSMAKAAVAKDTSTIDRLRYAAPLLVGAPLAVMGAAAARALTKAIWPSDEMEEINKKRSAARKGFDLLSFAGMFGPKIEFLVKGFERGQTPGGPVGDAIFRGGQAAFASASDPDSAKKGYNAKKQAYNTVVKPAITGATSAAHPFFGFLGNAAVNQQDFREAVIGDKPKK